MGWGWVTPTCYTLKLCSSLDQGSSYSSTFKSSLKNGFQLTPMKSIPWYLLILLGGAILTFTLVSVMDVLSSAAVAEICKLVDEGLAAVRLQIREREAEIGALRERLATACVSSSPAAHIGEKSGTTDKQTQRAQAELLLLKQEGLEHENIWKLESEGRPSRAGFEQREAKEDSKGPSVNTPSAHAEEAGDECRNPQGVSGSSGLETPVKAELVKEDRSQSFREAQAEQPAQTINGVNSRTREGSRLCLSTGLGQMHVSPVTTV
ncbi:uncharacterized protein LOC108933256 [Arapaima gigas]